MSRRDIKVLVNFNEAEYEMLKKEAEKNSLPLATLCRMLITKALKSEVS